MSQSSPNDPTPATRSPLANLSLDTWAVLLSLTLALLIKLGLIKSVVW